MGRVRSKEDVLKLSGRVLGCFFVGGFVELGLVGCIGVV